MIFMPLVLVVATMDWIAVAWTTLIYLVMAGVTIIQIIHFYAILMMVTVYAPKLMVRFELYTLLSILVLVFMIFHIPSRNICSMFFSLLHFPIPEHIKNLSHYFENNSTFNDDISCWNTNLVTTMKVRILR